MSSEFPHEHTVPFLEEEEERNTEPHGGEEWEGTARPQNEVERETQLAVNIPAALSLIRVWGGANGHLHGSRAAACSSQLHLGATLTPEGQGAKIIHWAGASE